MTVAILGGGLTIANLQSSEDFRILGKENDCGGLCRSNQENGYTFDIGGLHVIFSKIGIIKAYLKKIGIHLVGHFSEWEYYNMDACVRSAMNFVSRWRNGNPT